jgi:hypothetical protein
MKHMKISDPTGKPSTSPDFRRADVRGIRIDTIGQLEGRLKAKAMLVRPLLLSEERGDSDYETTLTVAFACANRQPTPK